MKKLQYIQPQTNVVLLKTSFSMLAGSNKMPVLGDQADLNPESMVGGDGTDAASRSYNNVWDDEKDRGDYGW